MRSRFPFRCLSALAAAAALATLSAAQVMQDPGTMPDGRRVSVPGAWRRPQANQSLPRRLNSSASSAPASLSQPITTSSTAQASLTPSTEAVPFSLLDKPAQPAKVIFANGRLSVDADNSSLSAILRQIGTTSGMAIEGLDQDARIFGTYGPGSPRDILSTLLDGAGYNVMMFGVTETGAPRELVLSARTNAPPAQGQPTNLAQQDEDRDETPVNNYPPAGEINPAAHPPLAPNFQQNSSGGVKTPAQMLQELQQMRQQQQQMPQQQIPQQPPQ